MIYTAEQIAIVVHEANRGMQMIQGDPCPSQTWPAEQGDIRQSAIRGVERALAGATPRQLHHEWFGDKLEEGWQYGPVKDGVNKTHPCMVPYDRLPQEQRAKDELFIAIVAVLASIPKSGR